MRARTFLVGLFIALLVGSAFLFWRNFGDPNPRVIRDAGRSIAAAQQDLGRFGTATPDSPPSESVPPEAAKLLQQQKHQLRDLIRAVLNSESPNASSEQLRNAAVQGLSNAGVKLPEAGANTGPAPIFGELSLRLERVLGSKNLVAARVGTSIPCGVDNALYIFERDGAIWSPVLSYEAPQLASIKDGYGALDYAVSPITEGNWYVLVASANPSCASAFQELRYAILRKGSDPEHPKSVVNATSSIYEGWDEVWKLHADPDTAQITWWSNFKLDTSILIRAHVARYKIAGDSATRIPPFAFYPEDFLDEWAEQPWELAKDSVIPEVQTDAEAIHKWLHGSDFTGTISFIQPCPIPDHWQIAVTLEGTVAQPPPMKTLFVDISRDGDLFRLDRIAADRAPGCPGNDLPPQRPQLLP
jgi:hypothetical protein